MNTTEKLEAVKAHIETIKKSDDLSKRERLLVAYINYQESMIANKEELIKMLNAIIDDYKTLEDGLK